MATPQTVARSQLVQVPVSSEPVVVRQLVNKAVDLQSMVVRNPAPDASAPMVQSDHRVFCLSY